MIAAYLFLQLLPERCQTDSDHARPPGATVALDGMLAMRCRAAPDAPASEAALPVKYVSLGLRYAPDVC
jgi:hypothetical protein